ncbi:hypothetical protein A2U01_0051122, partial [Trifolium medium]|nr:hypothetical protein [Trifolium medium]
GTGESTGDGVQWSWEAKLSVSGQDENDNSNEVCYECEDKGKYGHDE